MKTFIAALFILTSFSSFAGEATPAEREYLCGSLVKNNMLREQDRFSCISTAQIDSEVYKKKKTLSAVIQVVHVLEDGSQFEATNVCTLTYNHLVKTPSKAKPKCYTH